LQNKYLKSAVEMKTFHQFNEDLEAKRQQLRQRAADKMKAHKDKVASYQASQIQKQAATREREALKNEIKRELQSE
jgi:hypothetical protein